VQLERQQQIGPTKSCYYFATNDILVRGIFGNILICTSVSVCYLFAETTIIWTGAAQKFNGPFGLTVRLYFLGHNGNHNSSFKIHRFPDQSSLIRYSIPTEESLFSAIPTK
jgi:hypothetical protein